MKKVITLHYSMPSKWFSYSRRDLYAFFCCKIYFPFSNRKSIHLVKMNCELMRFLEINYAVTGVCSLSQMRVASEFDVRGCFYFFQEKSEANVLTNEEYPASIRFEISLKNQMEDLILTVHRIVN